MKKSSMAFAQALSLALVCLFTSAQASEIIFRPGPGLNNGFDTGTATAGKDASGTIDPNFLNFGASDVLFTVGISTCNLANANSWIRFDVSTLPTDVTNVYVGFTHHLHEACYSMCAADFYFRPVTSEWNEMSVTYSAPPTRGEAVLGPITITAPNDLGTREYEITSMYRQWKASPETNFGFEISSPTIGCANAAAMFYTYSSDSTIESQRPYLRVVVADAPTTFTIEASASSHGTIAPAGTVIVNSGGSQSFGITPSPGYHVANVLVDGSSVGAVPSYTFSNVTSDRTIEASFAIDLFTIIASAGPNGSIAPAGTVIVGSGSSQSFTIAPSAGYNVADVLVDGISVGAVTSYVCTNVTANRTIAATFVSVFDQLRGLLNGGCSIKKGIALSLNAKLDVAQAAANRGDMKAKAQVLGAFINEVNAQTGKGIPTECATKLIAYARQLL